MATWIVVADSSRARIFAAEQKHAPFQEISDPVHPASRLRGRELGTDAPGRAFDSAGQGRHAMGSKEQTHNTEEEAFARELADVLASAKYEKQYKRLYLVAPPTFLGHLREAMSDDVKTSVVKELNKELATEPLDQILSYFPELS